MKILEALDQFTTQLDADGRSIHTRRQYERHVRLFAAWLRDAGGSDDVAAIDHQTVARFFTAPTAQRRADGGIRKATSANALRSSLRTLFAYLHAAGIIAQNPTRLLRRAICESPPPRAIPADEQARLLDAMGKGEDAESQRDHVLFGTLAACGIRIGSALALDLEDIDLDRGTLHLRQMKGGRSATVFIPKTWLDAMRRHLADLPPGPVFRSRPGGRLSQRHAQRRLAIWCMRTGLARAYSPHAFRHSFALRIYDQTGDLGVVQAALTHRSISSTVVYARASEARVRAAVGAI